MKRARSGVRSFLASLALLVLLLLAGCRPGAVAAVPSQAPAGPAGDGSAPSVAPAGVTQTFSAAAAGTGAPTRPVIGGERAENELADPGTLPESAPENMPAGVDSIPGALSEAAVTLTPVPSVAAVTPLPPTFQVCSPLVEHPRDELPQILSDPYRPPPPGREERHHGVDFSYYRRGERESILGVEVQAVLGGQVAAALADSFPYGNLVIIETPGGSLPPDLASQLGLAAGESIYTLYAHMQSAPQVRVGDPVAACGLLGQVGRSGNAGVAHLHLEMRLGPGGAAFPVMGYYRVEATEEEKINYVRWRTGGEFRHFDPMVVILGEW